MCYVWCSDVFVSTHIPESAECTTVQTSIHVLYLLILRNNYVSHCIAVSAYLMAVFAPGVEVRPQASIPSTALSKPNIFVETLFMYDVYPRELSFKARSKEMNNFKGSFCLNGERGFLICELHLSLLFLYLPCTRTLRHIAK